MFINITNVGKIYNLDLTKNCGAFFTLFKYFQNRNSYGNNCIGHERVNDSLQHLKHFSLSKIFSELCASCLRDA
jgi:hypothetical protein